MVDELEYHRINSKALKLKYFLVPWDTKICGFNVAQIEGMSIRDRKESHAVFRTFIDWRNDLQVLFCSCRLPASQIKESIFLQENNFYFIEMNYQPVLNNLQGREFVNDSIEIKIASQNDRKRIAEIANQSFSMERFHVDPLLGPVLGNKRYESWVVTSFENPSHQILKIIIDGAIAGFFVVQYFAESCECYWHLTALAPEFQGVGLGKKVWNSMLAKHKRDGVDCVRTTISTRNTAVMAIYASLNFFFQPPTMTFHWHAERI